MAGGITICLLSLVGLHLPDGGALVHIYAYLQWLSNGMSEKDIVFWTFIVTVVGVIVTVVGVIFALGGIAVGVWTLRESSHVTKAQFLITMRNLLANYDDVHAKLRPGGEWAGEMIDGPHDASE
jgi:uncharacterized membrane protein